MIHVIIVMQRIRIRPDLITTSENYSDTISKHTGAQHLAIYVLDII